MVCIMTLCLLGPAVLHGEIAHAAEPKSSAATWLKLGEGVEYSTLRLVETPEFGDGVLHMVRVTPGRVELRAILASEQGVAPRTAREWANGLGLAVVINAGMFEMDHKTNVGYLRNNTHLNNPKWNKKYQSVLAFGPKHPGVSPLAFLDLDSSESKDRLETFNTVIQNLRLIKGEGQNVTKPSPRRWSEAAIAADRQGRLLFLFIRTPLSMHELSDRLLKLPLNVVRAMHVEGGPEASLSIRAENFSLDLSGSYETGFNENDDNRQQWPLPNVIGVIPKLKGGE